MKKKKVDLEAKRANERFIVGQMIALYCHKKHKHKDGLCEECQDLLEYAQHRIDVCPFMENKTFCSNCRVHCYKKEYREKIRTVMRFSGPRMLFVHPILAIKHVYLTIKEKKKIEREEEEKARKKAELLEKYGKKPTAEPTPDTKTEAPSEAPSCNCSTETKETTETK